MHLPLVRIIVPYFNQLFLLLQIGKEEKCEKRLYITFRIVKTFICCYCCSVRNFVWFSEFCFTIGKRKVQVSNSHGCGTGKRQAGEGRQGTCKYVTSDLRYVEKQFWFAFKDSDGDKSDQDLVVDVANEVSLLYVDNTFSWINLTEYNIFAGPQKCGVGSTFCTLAPPKYGKLATLVICSNVTIRPASGGTVPISGCLFRCHQRGQTFLAFAKTCQKSFFPDE